MEYFHIENNFQDISRFFKGDSINWSFEPDAILKRGFCTMVLNVFISRVTRSSYHFNENQILKALDSRTKTTNAFFV